jgi:molybdopterin synthase sulfur carrier subunit
VNILYFAWVREQIGLDCETLDPPAEIRDVAALIGWLAMRSAAHAGALGDHARLRAAVDQQFVALDAPIAGAAEIALFPPVTGG